MGSEAVLQLEPEGAEDDQLQYKEPHGPGREPSRWSLGTEKRRCNERERQDEVEPPQAPNPKRDDCEQVRRELPSQSRPVHPQLGGEVRHSIIEPRLDSIAANAVQEVPGRIERNERRAEVMPVVHEERRDEE